MDPLVPFYIAGGVLTAWALLLSALGVMREDFPSAGVEKLVGVVTVLLVAAAVGTGVVGAIEEERHEEETGESVGAVPALTA